MTTWFAKPRTSRASSEMKLKISSVRHVNGLFWYVGAHCFSYIQRSTEAQRVLL